MIYLRRWLSNTKKRRESQEKSEKKTCYVALRAKYGLRKCPGDNSGPHIN